ncbi:MAG: hypothetical protein LBV47_05150 [Bacteroidales bacterium]|jgi:hypothetical protein|nr:hypothetical protein [Bacteroidales bacterium]
MEEQLLPEEQMRIEQQAIEAFLFAAEYGDAGINHLINAIKVLKKRLNDFEV